MQLLSRVESEVRTYFVYILTSMDNTVLYTGVTNDLYRRVVQHRSGQGGKFTDRYHATKLVYYEILNEIYNAITREKQIKGGSRQKKIDLVNEINRIGRTYLMSLCSDRHPVI